jgi:hypothetical protein
MIAFIYSQEAVLLASSHVSNNPYQSSADIPYRRTNIYFSIDSNIKKMGLRDDRGNAPVCDGAKRRSEWVFPSIQLPSGLGSGRHAVPCRSSGNTVF